MLRTLAAALIAASVLTAPALAESSAPTPQAGATQAVNAAPTKTGKAKPHRKTTKKTNTNKHAKNVSHMRHATSHKRAHIAHRAPKSSVN